MERFILSVQVKICSRKEKERNAGVMEENPSLLKPTGGQLDPAFFVIDRDMDLGRTTCAYLGQVTKSRNGTGSAGKIEKKHFKLI